MVYTVTFNPSIDYVVLADGLVPGRTNRTTWEEMLPGGKGINVAAELAALGVPGTALGFCAGFTGREILRMLRERNVACDFRELPAGYSRINVKLRNVDGTELNGMGPAIDADSLAWLMSRLRGMRNGDTLVLSGSVPPSVPQTIYRDILAELSREDRDLRFVVDASGPLLADTLPYHPFLIKPNRHELEELFAAKISAPEEAEPYARRLQERGARNILVSMGGQGAALLDEMGEFRFRASAGGMVINAVGAGDAMVAGFLAGWDAGHGAEYALRMGIAAGAASAFTDWMASGEQVMEVLRTLKKEEHADMDSACPHAECL